MRLRLTLNGNRVTASIAPEATLLEVLRQEFGIFGVKHGCETGECGACTVIVDGEAVNSCLMLAVRANGKKVETIEGLAIDGKLHPLQKAFLEQTGMQCGICTPGFLMAAKALLDKYPQPDERQIRHWLAGNLCRCTGYDKLVRSVMTAAESMSEARQ